MKRYGLIGEQVEHSLSRRLHQMFGDYSYDLISLRPEELEGFLREGGFDGVNVTIPYKRRVIPFCAELSDIAREAGSVNTLLRLPDGSLYGDNTDAFGFAFMARRAGIDFTGQKTLVLGSGGTGHTVCAVVKAGGGTPVVISRQGENDYQSLSRHQDASLLVNTTPVGMYPHPIASPMDIGLLPNLRGVLDVVYRPLRTHLLQQAAARGLPYAGGLSMLVGQAAKASALFTGQSVSEEAIEKALHTLREEATNLVLIGMPGVGKTTLGQGLAKALEMPLVDMDAEIERTSGQSIASLFERSGEAAFRDMEAACVKRWSAERGYVLVTGGGAVLREENRQNLRQNGFVVQITRSLDLLPLEDRPLSSGPEALKRMWAQRSNQYAACADVVIANEGAPEACVQKIVEAYHEALYY